MKYSVTMQCGTCKLFLVLEDFPLRHPAYSCRSCESLAGAEKVLANTTQPGDGPAISSESSAILQQSVKNSQHQPYLCPKPDLIPTPTVPNNSKMTSLDHFLEPQVHRPRTKQGHSVANTTYANQEKTRDD